MIKYSYAAKETDNMSRAMFRNLPNSCIYCAYRLRPSSFNDCCSVYCRNIFKPSSNSKE